MHLQPQGQHPFWGDQPRHSHDEFFHASAVRVEAIPTPCSSAGALVRRVLHPGLLDLLERRATLQAWGFMDMSTMMVCDGVHSPSAREITRVYDFSFCASLSW